MNERWSLDVIYKGLDSPEYQADFARYRELCAEYAAFAERPVGDSHAFIGEYLKRNEELAELGFDLSVYPGLRMNADTGDKEAVSALGRIDSLSSAKAGPDAALEAKLAALPDLEEQLESCEYFREHAYLLRSVRKNARYLLLPREEELLARMNMSGADAWEQLRDVLTSGVEVEYRGGTETLSGIRNMAYSADASVRKDAYEAELRCYEKIKESGAYALNSIKLQTITECELRGYGSALDRSLNQSHMKKETLDALFAAIDEYLPEFRRYLKLKAKALGHKNGLPWYDLFAPMGKSGKKYTVEDARDYLLRIFGTFDTELRDMVAKAFADSWIDFYPRQGKVGGAFCEILFRQRQSRVLTNFGGELGDVTTLAHELGHAFHNEMLFGKDLICLDLPMPLAETASTFNENLLISEALDKAGTDGEKLALVESQLMDACQVIVDIYSRFLFEKAVLENRSEQFMDAEALCELMTDAQKKTYGDGLDSEYMHPYMWLCKSHYYSGSLSYYNFPYAFGGLFARSLYAMYREQGQSFVPAYKKMLASTTSMDAEEAAAICGADISSKDFWRKGLQSYKEEIDLFEQLLTAEK